MELASVVARNAELEKQLSQFTNMQEEIVTNANMNPLTAQVIAREQGTYFSVFTVNKGSRDGVEPYMAVTISGALVGFTETLHRPYDYRLRRFDCRHDSVQPRSRHRQRYARRGRHGALPHVLPAG